MVSQVLKQLSDLSWFSCNGQNVTGFCRLNYPVKVAILDLKCFVKKRQGISHDDVEYTQGWERGLKTPEHDSD